MLECSGEGRIDSRINKHEFYFVELDIFTHIMLSRWDTLYPCPVLRLVCCADQRGSKCQWQCWVSGQ